MQHFSQARHSARVCPVTEHASSKDASTCRRQPAAGFPEWSLLPAQVERLLGRMPHEAGSPAGGAPRGPGHRSYSHYGLGAGGGSGGLQTYSMRALAQLPASGGPEAGHPPNRIRTASVSLSSQLLNPASHWEQRWNVAS